MRKLPLLLLLLVVTSAGGCSRSSANPPGNQDPLGSAAPARASAADTAAPQPAAAGATGACDDACTKLAVCHERFYEGESFRHGDACVQDCIAMSASERAEWTADVADAHRTNKCAVLFEEADRASGDAPPATLAAGEPQHGCFAWSARLDVAACIVGHRGSHGTHLQLSFVGGGPAAIPLVDAEIGGTTEIDEALANQVSATLAEGGFSPLAEAATSLTARKPAQVNGVSITWTTRQAKRGGDGIAPTYDNRVIARCGGRTLELFRDEEEGVTASATVRPVGGHVLVEVSLQKGLEGEFGEDVEAVLVESSSCKVTRSRR